MKHFNKVVLSTMMLFAVALVGCDEQTIQQWHILLEDSVRVGETITLKTNITDPEWYVDDESIASINEQGVLEGKSEGIVTVTVQSIADSSVVITRMVSVLEGEEDCPSGKICPTLSYLPPRQPEEVEVLLGIDRIDEYLDLFEDKRVGLITNPTGINSQYKSTIDVLNEKVNLVALFSPEHGIRGNLQAGEQLSTYIDEITGLPVYSLYGDTLKPTKAMMDQIDILCIDIQDAGARNYTYIYTMSYAMEAAAEYDKEFVVFDRPNPAGGHIYEGNILNPAFSSFIGRYPIVQRHGMTIAELAYMFNEEFNINCNLSVVLMDGWGRYMFYEDTNLPWVIPSPNLPTQNTAIMLTATSLIQATNMSEGRGTTIPFELIGAPFINADEYAQALNDLELDGVIFRPAYFIPTFSKNANQLNAGVQIHITDKETFKPVKTGWAILEVTRNLYPNSLVINSDTLNRQTGTNYITNRTYTLEEQFTIIEQDTIAFGLIRDKYLLYVEVSE